MFSRKCLLFDFKRTRDLTNRWSTPGVNLLHQTRFRCQSLWFWSDAGRVLNSMLCPSKVRLSYIAYIILIRLILQYLLS